MKRLLITLMVAGSLGLATPAYADPTTYHRGGEECENGSCSEREESYENTGCKYVCPSFERSPVHDAFNFSPFICMPGATCYDGDRPQEGQQPQPS